MRKLGQNAVALDAVLAETARDGAIRLKPFGKTLKEAIDFYLVLTCGNKRYYRAEVVV
jgi:hypothetical protein